MGECLLTVEGKNHKLALSEILFNLILPVIDLELFNFYPLVLETLRKHKI